MQNSAKPSRQRIDKRTALSFWNGATDSLRRSVSEVIESHRKTKLTF